LQKKESKRKFQKVKTIAISLS